MIYIILKLNIKFNIILIIDTFVKIICSYVNNNSIRNKSGEIPIRNIRISCKGLKVILSHCDIIITTVFVYSFSTPSNDIHFGIETFS